jgi:hypothetical protein
LQALSLQVPAGLEVPHDCPARGCTSTRKGHRRGTPPGCRRSPHGEACRERSSLVALVAQLRLVVPRPSLRAAQM